MLKPYFLVDVDEVLYDLHDPVLALMAKVTGRRHQIEEIKVWDLFSVLGEEERTQVFEYMNAPGFCSALRPFPEAVVALDQIRRHAEVIAVTNPYPSPSWVYERSNSLKRDFGFSRGQIIYTSAKYLVRGDYFLDDNPNYVSSWAAENPDKCSMLWHTPNTRTLGLDHLRVFSWDQVLERVS